MSYRCGFSNAAGWSAGDVSVRLNNNAGLAFLCFLRQSGVDTLIQYCACSARPKTIIPDEAKFLSKEGFGILPVFQDGARYISNLSQQAGTANARAPRILPNVLAI
ncbi:hypothetical protein GV67_00075 [Pseudorhizobium pelagicum]|uniref:Uncharacterized protein n=1 Tax=Pseudorhizobium pelagicum TaxID=1509405 RepID=A0A922NZS5_9HYPH|nr:hypothetical protein GV68_03030 [Pseudorhizobium pelagicum]KEQ09122.1 hypothetical protein GV67_00075 [Pseudorhizobium pelagicum]